MKLKKAQIWQIDFIVSIIIVIGAIIITYQYVSHLIPSKTTADLSPDAFYLSEALLGTGIPANWNISNVQQIGLVSNGTLDTIKVNALYNMSDTLRRLKFGIQRNIYITISNKTSNITFAGKNYTGTLPTNPSQVAIATRYAVLNGRPVILRVTLWD